MSYCKLLIFLALLSVSRCATEIRKFCFSIILLFDFGLRIKRNLEMYPSISVLTQIRLVSQSPR